MSKLGFSDSDDDKKMSSLTTSSSQPHQSVVTASMNNKHVSDPNVSTLFTPPSIPSVKKRSRNEFSMIADIGEGSFSQVYKAKDLLSNEDVAIKVIRKQHVIKHKELVCVWMEKAVLQRISHPFIVKLICTFQDEHSLYFVLNLATQRDLLHWIGRLGHFDLECTTFYTTQLITAIEFLHNSHIVHRDLKPENILITDKLHICLIDFGSAIILNDPSIKPSLFTGTPHYVSPEMLNGRRLMAMGASSNSSLNDNKKVMATNTNEVTDSDLTHSVSSYLMDLWALGCIVYQMMSGKKPFNAFHEYQMFEKILNLRYEPFPANFDAHVRDFVERLLVIEPSERLGSVQLGGFPSLKAHSMFASVTSWASEDIINKPAPKILQAYATGNTLSNEMSTLSVISDNNMHHGDNISGSVITQELSADSNTHKHVATSSGNKASTTVAITKDTRMNKANFAVHLQQNNNSSLNATSGLISTSLVTNGNAHATINTSVNGQNDINVTNQTTATPTVNKNSIFKQM